MTVWLFPGQGSQRAGMANGLSACGELFVTARAYGLELETLCTAETVPSWPPHLIQPAIFLTSLGAAKAAQNSLGPPDAVAGHSLGELAALVVAGCMSFEDGLAVVDARSKAMAAAGRNGPGGMAAVLGLDSSTVSEVCEEIGDLWAANLNSPTQTVVSGKQKAIATAAKLFLESGAMRVVRLDVPVAAHTPMMKPAAKALEKALSEVTIHSPSLPFYSVVDAKAHKDPAEIRDLLVRSLTSPVRFRDTLAAMNSDGHERFVEVGPGRALRGLVRENLPNAEVGGVSSDDATPFRAVETGG